MSDLIKNLRDFYISAPNVPSSKCMNEAADEIERLNGLVALQKKDMKVAMDNNERLRAELKDANSALRSAAEVAQRDGKDTNWDAFRSRLAKVLLAQAKALAVEDKE